MVVTHCYGEYSRRGISTAVVNCKCSLLCVPIIALQTLLSDQCNGRQGPAIRVLGGVQPIACVVEIFVHLVGGFDGWGEEGGGIKGRVGGAGAKRSRVAQLAPSADWEPYRVHAGVGRPWVRSRPGYLPGHPLLRRLANWPTGKTGLGEGGGRCGPRGPQDALLFDHLQSDLHALFNGPVITPQVLTTNLLIRIPGHLPPHSAPSHWSLAPPPSPSQYPNILSNPRSNTLTPLLSHPSISAREPFNHRFHYPSPTAQLPCFERFHYPSPTAQLPCYQPSICPSPFNHPCDQWANGGPFDQFTAIHHCAELILQSTIRRKRNTTLHCSLPESLQSTLGSL